MVIINTAGLNLNVKSDSKPSTILTISLSTTTVNAPMMLYILSVKSSQTDGAVIPILNIGTITIYRKSKFSPIGLCYIHLQTKGWVACSDRANTLKPSMVYRRSISSIPLQKLKMMIRERPTLYEWKSVGDANVEFQFRTSSSGTDQGFKLRLRCDRK